MAFRSGCAYGHARARTSATRGPTRNLGLEVAEASDTIRAAGSDQPHHPISRTTYREFPKRGNVARKPEHEQSHVIEEIEGLAERGAQWIRDHLALTITTLVVILASAAGIGAFIAHRNTEAEAASDAFDRVTTEYRKAMGADPDALEMPELANPAAAAAIRSEFAEQFAAVAEEHSGTVAGALARLEQGNMSAADGETDAAIEIWQGAIDDLGGNPNFRAILEQRIGQAYDGDARWLEAAESYARAGEVETYPLRHWALAQAARCFQQAGEVARAREFALRVDTESPDLMLPQHLSTMLAELRQLPTP
jgi:tetratricopeptide (TPR) repeat protein